MGEDATKENSAAQPRPQLGTFKRPQFKAPGLASTAGPAQKKLATTAKPSGKPIASLPQAVNPLPPPAAGSHDYFSVLYTKYQPTKKLRKNKKFNDGVLGIAPGNKASLYDAEGKQVADSTLRGYDAASMGNGSQVIMGNWEVEIDEPLLEAKFRSGEAFLKSSGPPPPASSEIAENSISASLTACTLPAPLRRPLLPQSSAPFKRPTGGTAPGPRPGRPRPPQQLHDPTAADAVVLNAAQWQGGVGGGADTCAVVLDPLLARQMRPHQIEGVKFLYDCVAGIRDPNQLGAILADAMGLGKTLTTLALVWTLLRQGRQGRPTVQKAIVVAPSSLTRNWAAEARKWLGDERLRTVIIPPGPEGAAAANSFKHGSVTRVAIASYDTLRQHAQALAGCAGILVADEGHRLKSAQGNKTISALLALGCPRRVILTGTPLQNNLSEFFAMVDFVCPEDLGTLSTFNRVFAAPIARSREKGAGEEDRALGNARSSELARRVEAFVLRRGAEINAAYLPPLSSFVVFCRPSQLQLRLLSGALGSNSVRGLLGATGSDFGDQVLSVLTNLRKICNHPTLYDKPGGTDDFDALPLPEGEGETLSEEDPSLSGKMATLMVLLQRIVGSGGDSGSSGRCVVVSQSTAMLDLVGRQCVAQGWSTVRIDGSTDPSKRQDIVDSFNRHCVGQIFLLSTTAGGAGLNLVGASKLILVDLHWNPAMDAQAMARVWRDGQKSPCMVYRLVTTGTLEEKVYQRQKAKGDIAAVTVGEGAAGGAAAKNKGMFSKEELRQLFQVRTDTACDTAEVLGAENFADVSGGCEDAPLKAAIEAGLVSFVAVEKQHGAAVQAAQAIADPVTTVGEPSGSGEVSAEKGKGDSSYGAASRDSADQLEVGDEDEW